MFQHTNNIIKSIKHLFWYSVCDWQSRCCTGRTVNWAVSSDVDWTVVIDSCCIFVLEIVIREWRCHPVSSILLTTLKGNAAALVKVHRLHFLHRWWHDRGGFPWLSRCDRHWTFPSCVAVACNCDIDCDVYMYCTLCRLDNLASTSLNST